MKSDRPLWRDPAFLAILAASLLLKLWLAVLASEVPPVNDENAYLKLARGLIDHRGFTSNFRPPLYPAFIAAGLALFDEPQAVRIAQAVVSAVSTILVYWIAGTFAGRRTALAAAALFAFDPVLVGFSHLLWSETLFIALFLGGIALLLRALESARLTAWGGAGLCFGLAGLTRTQLLTFLPLLLPWVALQVRRRGRPEWRSAAIGFAALTLATCAVVLPWSLRNLQTYDSFILVDTNGPYNVLVGTHPKSFHVDKDDRWSSKWGGVDGINYVYLVERDPAKVQRRALELAFENIAAEPAGFAQKSLWEASHLWTLDNFILRHLRNGWYGEGPERWRPALTLLLAGFSALLLASGWLGLVAQPPSPLRGLAGLALVHATLLFGLTYSLSRYSVPLRPVLALCGAWLMTHPAEAGARLWSRPGAGWRLAIALAGVLFLLAAWWRDVPLLSEMVQAAEPSVYRFQSGVQ